MYPKTLKLSLAVSAHH